MQHVRQRYDINDDPTDQDDRPWEDIPEEDMQTVHVFVYEDQPPWWTKDRLVTLAMGLLALALIVGLCCIPTGPSSQLQTLTLPARFHALHIQVRVSIHATGTTIYPATRATGLLTLYNGSILAQQLPAHFLLTTTNSLEIATSQAVVIPAANLPSLGVATVPAYAVLPGNQGNIQPDAIQATYGTSLEIKNLSAFTGGQDTSTKTVVTAHDKTTALETARAQLSTKQPLELQSSPCSENVSQQSSSLIVTWFCQYVTYQAPQGVQVLAVHLSGTRVVLTVRIVVRSITTHFVK